MLGLRIDVRVCMCVFRCVEILISEQFRRYKEKLQNIQELEYAEALAVSQLKLKRQNTVRAWGCGGKTVGVVGGWTPSQFNDG